MNILFALFVVVFGITELVRSECCRKTQISFTATGQYTCHEVDNEAHYPMPTGSGVGAVGQSLSENLANLREGNCEISICGDGRPPSTGTYCGRGPCNIFGCNCDFGCKGGNAVENFSRIHGNKVAHPRRKR